MLGLRGNHIFEQLAVSSLAASLRPRCLRLLNWEETMGMGGHPPGCYLGICSEASAEGASRPYSSDPSPGTLSPRREKSGAGKGSLAVHKDSPEGSFRGSAPSSGGEGLVSAVSRAQVQSLFQHTCAEVHSQVLLKH